MRSIGKREIADLIGRRLKDDLAKPESAGLSAPIVCSLEMLRQAEARLSLNPSIDGGGDDAASQAGPTAAME